MKKESGIVATLSKFYYILIDNVKDNLFLSLRSILILIALLLVYSFFPITTRSHLTTSNLSRSFATPH